MRTERIRAIERKSWRKRARTFRALGLTTRGGESKRRPNLAASERPAHYRQTGLEKWHRLCRRRLMLGQTSRGKHRTYLITLPATDAVVLETEIESLAREISRVFHDLPPSAQVKAVNLANAISNLKMRIQISEPQQYFRNHHLKS